MNQKQKADNTKRVKTKTADDFESVAKRLECDMDEGRFRERLGKIAKAKVASKTEK